MNNSIVAPCQTTRFIEVSTPAEQFGLIEDVVSTLPEVLTLTGITSLDEFMNTCSFRTFTTNKHHTVDHIVCVIVNTREESPCWLIARTCRHDSTRWMQSYFSIIVHQTPHRLENIIPGDLKSICATNHGCEVTWGMLHSGLRMNPPAIKANGQLSATEWKLLRLVCPS